MAHYFGDQNFVIVFIPETRDIGSDENKHKKLAQYGRVTGYKFRIYESAVLSRTFERRAPKL